MSARDDTRTTDDGMGDAPWMQYAGMVESGDPNAGQTIDEVAYGTMNEMHTSRAALERLLHPDGER